MCVTHMSVSLSMTPVTAPAGGPFLLPSQPFLTLSPHPMFIPCLPFPPQRKIALQTLAQKPYSKGEPVWPPSCPPSLNPAFWGRQGAEQPLPFHGGSALAWEGEDRGEESLRTKPPWSGKREVEEEGSDLGTPSSQPNPYREATKFPEIEGVGVGRVCSLNYLKVLTLRLLLPT